MRNFLMTLVTLSVTACASQAPDDAPTAPRIEELRVLPGSLVSLGGHPMDIVDGRVVMLRNPATDEPSDGPTTVGALDLTLSDPSGKLINTEIHLGTQVVDGTGDLLIESDQMVQGEIYSLQLRKLSNHDFNVYSQPYLVQISLDERGEIFSDAITGLNVQGMHLNVIASN